MDGCLAYVLLSGVVGYFVGRSDWKQRADEAAEHAGELILIAEEYKTRLKEYEK